MEGRTTDSKAGARGHILVADDHATLRVSLVAALRGAGFTAEGAETGEQAISLLASKAFDVLLADINMPGNAKLELLEVVRSLGIAVVLMTGQPSVDTAVGAVQAGAVDYLTKPFSTDYLLVRLDEAIIKSRAQKLRANLGEGLAAEDLERLSMREREVVTLLSVGQPPKEIANRLGLSPNTVRNHIKTIFSKLRVHSQVELLIKLRGRAP